MGIFNRQSLRKLKEENNQLKVELDEYRKKEKRWEKQQQINSYGIGNRLYNEHLSFLLDYLYQNNTSELVLKPTVKGTNELDVGMDEILSGLWYGIIVYDKEKVVMQIPTLVEGDSCFVSKVATKRREKNRFLMNAIAEYLSMEILNHKNSILIEIIEDFGAGSRLFINSD